MASTIQIKRTGQAGGSPSAIPSLSAGELAVDLVNKVLYTANNTVTFELARNTANNGLVLHDGSGNEITISAPALGSNYSLVLPQDDGNTDQFLQTNGSGTLTWATPSGSGNVNATNSPSDNQLAIWTDGTTIEGVSNLTFDGTTFTVGGADSSVFSATVAGVVNVSGDTNFNATTTSTSSTSGAVIVDGGVGVAENLNVGGDATITGNLTVNGTTTTLDVATVAIEDPIVKFANNNATDTTDIGFYGEYNKSTTVKYAAFFRDTTDKVWKVYNDLTNEPIIAGGDIDLTGGSLATLDAVIDGGTY